MAETSTDRLSEDSLVFSHLLVGSIVRQTSMEFWARSQNDPLSIPDVVLYSRLADTIAWCSSVVEGKIVNPSMRSPDLLPRILHDGRDDVVCDVGSTRHWRIRVTTVTPTATMPNLDGGRLLCYFPDADLCDGSAEAVSDGFFDAYNTPPWDTWVGYFCDNEEDNGCYDNYLLAYVPQILVDSAAAGVLVNPEQCIMWLEDTDVKIRSRVVEA